MNHRDSGDKRMVYSTDPNLKMNEPENIQSETLPPSEQKLMIKLDTKKRAGKSVTMLEGFRGRRDDFEALEKKLKSFCGTGGSSKDGIIIIQGDQREKIRGWLQKNGFKNPLMR